MRTCANCKYARKFTELDEDLEREFRLKAYLRDINESDYNDYRLCILHAIYPKLVKKDDVCENWKVRE